MKAGLVPLQHFCGGVGLGFTICSASSIILAEHSVVQMALHMAAEALTGQKRLIAHSRHAPKALAFHLFSPVVRSPWLRLSCPQPALRW